MSLADRNVLKPIVKIEVLRGPPNFTGELLERCLMKFQFLHRRGKGQFPQINMEFDNSSGALWNLAVFAIGATLKVRWGYDGFLSPPMYAPISTVKAFNMAQPGMASMTTPRPDVYGTVAMQARAHDWRAHWRVGKDANARMEGVRLSEAIRRIARTYGYPETKILVQTGLGPDGSEEEPVEAVYMPTGTTFARWLADKAGKRGFVGAIRNGEVHFHHPQWRATVAETIEYFKGPDVLAYAIEGDYTLNTQKVTSKGVDPFKGKVTTFQLQALPGGGSNITGAMTFLPISGGGGQTFIPEVMKPEDTVVALSKKDSEAAFRRLMSHVANKWNVALTVVGNPRLAMGMGVNLGNFGPAIDGMWIVGEIEHRVDNDGYTTVVKLRHRRVGVAQTRVVVYIFDANNNIIGTMTMLSGNYKYAGTGKNKRVAAEKNKRSRRPASTLRPQRLGPNGTPPSNLDGTSRQVSVHVPSGTFPSSYGTRPQSSR